MPRYIDLDELEEKLFPDGTSGGYWGYGRLGEILDDMTTIDIVYCKFCKNSHAYGGREHIVHCIHHGMSKYIDDFCSYETICTPSKRISGD